MNELRISALGIPLLGAIVVALIARELLSGRFDEVWRVSGLIGVLAGLGIWRSSWSSLSIDESLVRYRSPFWHRDPVAFSDIQRVGFSAEFNPLPQQRIIFVLRGHSGVHGLLISVGLLDRRRARRWVDELNRMLVPPPP